MIFELTILGNSSATPTLQRHPTGQVLNYNEKLFLIDCGEGSQTQMLRYRIKYHRINNIFISHLHGDHFFGLMGFLSTLHLQGRTNPLTIFAPQPLEHIIRYQLEVSETRLRYPLSFCYLNHEYSTRIYEDTDLTIETIILKHRIPCTGFLFREKPRARKLIKARIQEDEVPVSAYSDLKEGHDHTAEDGRVFRCADYTMPPSPPRSFAYCSDTIYNEDIIGNIAGVNLLYHEATFLHAMLERAEQTFHTTALQAGTIARKAMAGKLVIGHFSARYSDLSLLLSEARQEFENTMLAIEGEKYSVE